MVKVIPAILAENFESAKKQAEVLNSFKELIDWVQIDVEDGKFVPYQSWKDPQEAKLLFGDINIEVHLMVRDPLEEAKGWDKIAKRLIFHTEALNLAQDFPEILKFSLESGAQIALALNPETQAEILFPYLEALDLVVVMGVNPGKAGQKFQEKVLAKIKTLKSKFPSLEIEVDGGINLETGKKALSFGADILVSHSFIFNSKDPKEAFELLSKI